MQPRFEILSIPEQKMQQREATIIKCYCNKQWKQSSYATNKCNKQRQQSSNVIADQPPLTLCCSFGCFSPRLRIYANYDFNMLTWMTCQRTNWFFESFDTVSYDFSMLTCFTRMEVLASRKNTTTFKLPSLKRKVTLIETMILMILFYAGDIDEWN